MPSSRVSSQPSDQTRISYVSCIGRWVLYHWRHLETASVPGKHVQVGQHFGEGNGTPLQYSCLENPMDGGAWLAEVHGVAKSWRRLSNFTFTFHFHEVKWRRKWQPTPAFLPGESQRWGSLVGYHLWGLIESDTTEAT